MLGMSETASKAGQVWAHVGQAFVDPGYDVIVAGAGRMGAACALYLRQLAPDLRTLLLDEGGLPNEDGATILAPGIWTGMDLPAAWQAEALWVRTQVATVFGDAGFDERTLLELHAQEMDGTVQTSSLQARFPTLSTLVQMEGLPFARLDPQAATYRPGAVALACAQQAIRQGADLMLNARATLVPGGVQVERLTVTNTHQIITHETHVLSAPRVIIALGAGGPYAAEHDLGVHTAHARAYRQVPRLNVSSDSASPVLRASGLTLRPQAGGYTLVPPIHHRDPHGYVPQGGHLTGVPTGLRRETLEDLVALMDLLPVLGTGALELGRSISDVPGAWLVLPGGSPGGRPQHQALPGGAHLLLGGPLADVLGLSTAYDLAASMAGVQTRPWN
nr:FAD-dependent oxidoreductase [Deinococcus deserti]